MTTEAAYKFSMSFKQSLSSGMIGFDGTFQFDTFDEYTQNKDLLFKMLKEQEEIFKADYKVVSTIPNNMKDLANGKKKEAAE